MAGNWVKSKWSSLISKPRHWAPIPICILLYIGLGMMDVVPWFDTTPILTHIIKANVALKNKDYSTATRHVVAAMRRIDKYPQYDKQCWGIMNDVRARLSDQKYSLPSYADLDSIINTKKPDKVMVAFFTKIWKKIQIYQLKQLNQQIETVTMAAIEREEREPTNVQRYIEHMNIFISFYLYNEFLANREKVNSLLLRLHRRLIKLLPAGDKQVINSLENIDTKSNIPIPEKLQLVRLEIKRCQQAKPCPILALLELENKTLPYVNDAQKFDVVSRCINSWFKIFYDNKIPYYYDQSPFYYLPEWFSLCLQYDKDIEAQRFLNDFIIGARQISNLKKRKEAVSILTKIAFCWANDGGYSGGVSFQKPNIQILRKIIIAQDEISPSPLLTALVWSMIAKIYQKQNDNINAERCYNQCFKILNKFFKCNDVTIEFCAGKIPGNGIDNVELWDIYRGYASLVSKTNPKLVEKIYRVIEP